MFGQQIPVHVIDFEGAPSYGVVEYGIATLVDGKITETVTRMCRAFAPIDPHDIAVHGITYEQSLQYEPFENDFDIFVDLRRRGPLAAHNARYEARLVKQAWAVPGIVPAWEREQDMRHETCDMRTIKSAPGESLTQVEFFSKAAAPVLESSDCRTHETATWGPWIDSCALARKLAPGLSRYKLAAVVKELGLENELNAIALDRCPADRVMYHAALYDAIAAALILKKLLCEAESPVDEEKLFSVKG